MQYVLLAVGLAIGAGIAWMLASKRAQKDEAVAKADADRIIAEARKQAELVQLEAVSQSKEIVLKAKGEAEKEAKDLVTQVARTEERLQKREENLERKNELCDNRDRDISNREKGIAKQEERAKQLAGQAEGLVEERKLALQKVAQMTPEEAKRLMMEDVLVEARDMAVHNVTWAN